MEEKTLKDWLDQYTTAYSTLAKRRVSANAKKIGEIGEELKTLERKEATGADVAEAIQSTEKRIRALKFHIVRDKELLKKMNFDDKSKVNALQDKILKHPKVESIRIDFTENEATLNVFTSSLSYRGERSELLKTPVGKYRICLSFALKTGTKSLLYRMYSLEYHRDNLDHWAVSAGNPCFGEWTDVLSKYAKSGEPFLLIDSLILFLETAGDNNAYAHLPGYFSPPAYRKRTAAETTDRKKKVHWEIYHNSSAYTATGAVTGEQTDIANAILNGLPNADQHAEEMRRVLSAWAESAPNSEETEDDDFF